MSPLKKAVDLAKVEEGMEEDTMITKTNLAEEGAEVIEVEGEEEEEPEEKVANTEAEVEEAVVEKEGNTEEEVEE